MARTDTSSTSPILGMLVRNAAGDDTGSISDVVCDTSSGRLRFALVGLHHETSLLVVPWEMIQIRPDERSAVLNVSEPALRGAPRIKWADWSRVTNPQWDRDVYAYYGCHPYWEEAAEDTTTTPQTRRHLARRSAELGAIILVLLIGLGYLISKQGWAMTANQVYAVAGAVKDTTVAVRDTSNDAAITAKAKAALALSKRISALEINVDTTDAVVTVAGRVPTPAARALAGQIVADTSGVREVRNVLTVDPTMKPEEDRERLVRRVDDLETERGLSEALQDAPELDSAKVKVRVVDGAATLEGTVSLDAQKARAEDLAWNFPGVKRVTNRIR